MVDAATAQALNAAIASAKFEGKEGSSLSLRGIGGYARIVLNGVGTEGDRVTHIRNASGKAAQDLRDEAQQVTITGGLNQDDAAAAALGYAMGQYRFDRYKTVDRKAPPTNPVTIISSDAGSAEA
jgi:leucyl aminopeptidase